MSPILRKWAYLLDLNGDESEIQVVVSPTESYWFALVDDAYIAAYGALQSLSHDATNQVFRFIQLDGSVWEFYDLDQTANPAGALKSFAAPGQQAVTLLHADASSPLSEMQRSYADESGVTTVESFLYTYLAAPDENAGRISAVTLRRNVAEAGWDPIQQALFTYYNTGAANGSEGDLQLATHQLPGAAGSGSIIESYFYGYYLDSTSGLGFAHGLRFALGPET